MSAPHLALLGADPTDSDLDDFLSDLVQVRSDRHITGGHHGPDQQKSHGRAGYMSVDDIEIVKAAGRLSAASIAAEPAITADMHVIASVGGGELEGLDFRLKSDESIRRKLATDSDFAGKQMPVHQREAAMKDVNRYTQIYSEHEYSAGVERSRVKAEELGYHVTPKNGWRDNDSGYAGYHMTLRKEGFPPVELQFHTKASFRAKEIGDPPRVPASHKLYESLRTTRYKPKKLRIQAEIDALWAPIRATMPPGATLLREAGARRSV